MPVAAENVWPAQDAVCGSASASPSAFLRPFFLFCVHVGARSGWESGVSRIPRKQSEKEISSKAC